MNGIPNDSSLLDPVVRRVLDALRSIVRELRLAAVSTERHHGLSSAQLFVLHTLRHHGELSLGEVAQRTFTDQSSVSVVVRKLEARGLVVKRLAQDDHRRLEIGLSPEGHRMLGSAVAPVQGALIQRLEALGAQDLVRLADLLEVLAPPGAEAPPMFFEEAGGKKTVRRKQGV
jgi:DNA-binding MarR family transcriptional regulator